MNAPAGLLDRPLDDESGNTRPRFFGPDRGLNRRTRRARGRRCKAGSTTTRGTCGKGGLFLNNRHYDPTTGVFVSVDPLVSKTMQPYVYGAANPVTYSDPTGLCPFTGCWEAFDAYLRGIREGVNHTQGAGEDSPGSPLPDQWIVRHAEKSAERSLEFNNPIGQSGAPVDPRPGQGHYELDPYDTDTVCRGTVCDAFFGFLAGWTSPAFFVGSAVTDPGGTALAVVNPMTYVNGVASCFDGVYGAYACGGAALSGGALCRGKCPSTLHRLSGREITFGSNVRIAPLGNRTGNPYGRWPHYHRRGVDPATGITLPGQGIGRHRPWQTKSPDVSFWDRF